MSKAKTAYACKACGAVLPKWSGQCPDCLAWNSLEETVLEEPNKNRRLSGYAGNQPQAVLMLDAIEAQEETRMLSGLSELDRVLGGGVVSGSVILIGGDPGIGKSTLLLQTLAEMSQIAFNDSPPVTHKKAKASPDSNPMPLYVTGEESPQQVSLRAQRLGLNVNRIKLLTETHIERILQIAKAEQPRIMVIDSIQTVYTDVLQSAPGSVAQVRESAAQLVRFAKQANTAIFLVGHVTKEGALAGPRVLEHMVDTVLYFEGESDSRFRVIRAIKNRFGAVNELGIFAMTDKGLKEVSNPSAIFLSRHEEEVAGSVIMVTREGSRPMLVEVQALVDTSHMPNPRRVTLGLDQNRLAMLLAVLSRHGGIITYDQDVFVNIVGGVRVSETGADLAVLLAILSSLKNVPLSKELVVFGEVGLAGEIRPVPNGLERLREAAKHGFKKAIVPKANAPKDPLPDIEIVPVVRLVDALYSV
ncbi:DNA repair protein RadA [Beggiatoa alba B18LD]|uniref:DNA repair protein RadA n=1 Tax=Beggiatoa alba B18LD TaxID=395493 RepID=I3CG18_9GAMM|nr:DNA repair protein RadA [Beggiatoa alba]EIJ42561.1 DNA repair protein RadA [Beggiatoa alba B18LD]